MGDDAARNAAAKPVRSRKENSRNAAARPPEHAIRGSQRMLTSPLEVRGSPSILAGLASKTADNRCSLRSYANAWVTTRLPFEGRMGTTCSTCPTFRKVRP
jgi:hypothetical protein